MNNTLSDHALFSKAWSLTVLSNGTNTIGRMSYAMKALMPQSRKTNYTSEILHFATHIRNGVLTTAETIPPDPMDDFARMDLAYELTCIREGVTPGNEVENSRFMSTLRGIGPDIDFKAMGGSIYPGQSIERTGRFRTVVRDNKRFIAPQLEAKKPLTLSVSCWPAGSSTANVKIFESTTYEKMGHWLREAANPLVGEGAIIRVHKSNTQELLLRAVLVDGKWKPDDQAMVLAPYLRPYAGHIAFIIQTKSGYIPAIGRSVVSRGDNDSWIVVANQHEKVTDLGEAQDAVREISDQVDAVHLKPGKSLMGIMWLSQLGQPNDERTAQDLVDAGLCPMCRSKFDYLLYADAEAQTPDAVVGCDNCDADGKRPVW
jgi:hypothetical protein